MKFTLKQINDRTSDNICFDCGIEFLTDKQKAIGGVVTAHKGECGLCGKEKSVTDMRRFNYLNYPKNKKDECS